MTPLQFNINFYTIFLLIAGFITIAISIIILLKQKAAVWLFGVVMLLISIWSIAYGLELAQLNLSAMYIFIQFEYVGISFLPAFWIIFVIKYTNNNQWLSYKYIILLFLIPVITLGLVITNRWHHLYYDFLSVVQSGDLYLLAIEAGPWYNVHVIYFYLCMLGSTYLLFRYMQQGTKKYQIQNIILFVAALIPWVSNMLYLTGLRLHSHIDITPFAFLFTAFLISYGLFRYQLFNLIPIAREIVMQHMQEGMLILDENNRIIDYNTRVKTMLSYYDNLLGMNMAEIFQKDEHVLFALQKDVKKIELEWEERIYEVNINYITTPYKRVTGKSLLFRDITQLKDDCDKMQEQSLRLHRLNTLKDKLLSVISHDIRGPIANLKQLVNMLNKNILNEQEFKNLLPGMTSSLTETSILLDNLLFWSRNQINGFEVHFENVKIHTLIKNNTELFKQQAQDKDIRILNQVSEKILVPGDRDLIDLVLRNLISNALKFSDQGGNIEISIEEDEKMLIIMVSDKGIGMNAKIQQRILNNENFSNPGTKNEKGAGIGLHLSKEFLEKIGGSLSLQSEEGKGTTFYVHLQKNNKEVSDI